MDTIVDEVIAAWVAPLERKLAEKLDRVRRTFYLTQHLLRLLAEGQPVPFYPLPFPAFPVIGKNLLMRKIGPSGPEKVATRWSFLAPAPRPKNR